jgi:putative thioredoxin
MLGPILERLAREPGSGFVLAKVNSDHNQSLAMRYDVRGIPAVKAFSDGKVVDEFVGAQPEPNVRAFIQRVTAQAAARRPSAAQGAKRSPEALLERAQRSLREGNGCEALRALEGIGSAAATEKSARLLGLARLVCEGDAGAAQGESREALLQAAGALKRRDHSAALYHLLLATNQGDRGAAQLARNHMQGLFDVLGSEHTLTRQYQPLVTL